MSAVTLNQQSKYEGVTYSFDQSEYKTTWKRALTLHQQSKHEGVTYSCDKCEYKAT